MVVPHSEANRKRSESAKGQPRTDTGFSEKDQVFPQSEGVPDEDRNKGATSKATLIGVNRAAVEGAEFIKKNGLAEKVVQGEITAAHR